MVVNNQFQEISFN